MSFSNCKFCSGKGCLACAGERKKYEAEKTERIRNWKPPTEGELKLALSIARSIWKSDEIPEGELLARLQTPEPLMEIKTESDMELASELMGGDALQRMIDEAGGDTSAFLRLVEGAAEKFRIIQGKRPAD